MDLLFFGKKNKMKYLIVVFLFSLNLNVSSQNYDYTVKYNGKIIENRHYQNDTLSSIIAYNCTDTKDSIIYNGKEISWFHYDDNGFRLDNLWPFHKFYYAYFDKTLQNNRIYDLVKSHLLIEDVLWSLAVIDNDISTDITSLSKDGIISQRGTEHCITYKIHSQCILHQLFETYKNEVLETLSIYIKNGFLVKLFFEGEKTNKTVTFKYKQNSLIKEKIYYTDAQLGKTLFQEEYKYFRKE